MKSLLASFFTFFACLSFGQTPLPGQDKDAIKSMTGCYSISFDYAETFAPDSAYKTYPPYHSKADAEWVFVDEESDHKLVLQHLLVINDTMIIKHWRQDWIYENTELYAFDSDRTWRYKKHPKQDVEGQWTQKVYQVDDSPRYEGNATWVHVDGRHYWESTSDAPLPRREFTKRSDYNVMQRTNRHALTEYGWVHEQDNLKLLRKEGKDELIAEEKGYNKYYKIDDKHCAAAADWWSKHGDYWRLVRKAWTAIFDRGNDIQLSAEKQDKRLWQALFELQDEVGNLTQTAPEELYAQIMATIELYVIDPSPSKVD